MKKFRGLKVIKKKFAKLVEIKLVILCSLTNDEELVIREYIKNVFSDCEFKTFIVEKNKKQMIKIVSENKNVLSLNYFSELKY